MRENPWIPDHVKDGITPKQAEFLVYEGREALFGGAAGGGKSVALLLAALQFVEEPGYSALLLRRTYKQLAKADSILSKAKEWLLPLQKHGVRWKADEYKFTFPSGATLEFGHMENANSIYDYQGGSWAFVGADEATQFTEQMLSYPRTRQRRTVGSRVPIRWRGASNPGGIGHKFVKERYVKALDGRDPATPDRQFFPATLDDNPHIDREDYVRQLQDSGIDPVTLAQLLRGDWDAFAGGLFKEEWLRGRFWRCPDSPDFLVTSDGERFRWADRPRWQTCDPNASENVKADRFVLSTFLATPRGKVCWVACEVGRYEIDDQVGVCQRSYRRWTPQFVAVEEVLNQRALAQLLRKSSNPMMNVHSVSPLGKRKRERSAAAVVLAANGRLLLPADVRYFPLDDVLAELTTFTGEDGREDDIADTLFYAADVMGLVGAADSTGSAPTHGSVPGGTRR